jgi:hypothetical protein
MPIKEEARQAGTVQPRRAGSIPSSKPEADKERSFSGSMIGSIGMTCAAQLDQYQGD